MTVTTCECGKPIEHLHADLNSPDWPCRMPQATAAAKPRMV